MKSVGLDTETYLIQPGRQAPRVVCVSLTTHGLLTPSDPIVKETLKQAAAGRLTIVGHNIAYDMACLGATCPDYLPYIFDAYEAHAVECTQINEKFRLLQRGELGLQPRGYFSLDQLTQQHLGTKPLDKGEDGWRLRYGTLDGVPFTEWPQRAIDYAKLDAAITLQLWSALPRYYDAPAQAKYAFALQLMSCWGLRTHGPYVATLRDTWETKRALAEAEVKRASLLRADGTKDTKRLQSLVEEAWRSAPGQPLHTRTGKYSTSADTLDYLAEYNPVLAQYAQLNHTQKILNTYVKLFEQGTELPLHPRVDVLKATGRISQSKPNMQQLPREAGIREVFVPREGNVYLAVDLDTAEIRGYAQTLMDVMGWSTIADGYIADPSWDPHVHTAAAILGISPEEAAKRKAAGDPQLKEARQAAKGLNFGLPGGMGVARLKDHLKAAAGVVVTEQRAAELKRIYEQAYPETVVRGNQVGAMCEAGGGTTNVITFRSKRERGGASYCAARNYDFQPVVADVTKLAAFRIARKQYCDTTSTLYGTRTVNMVHDELVLEVPADNYRACNDAVIRELLLAAEVWCPDVPFRAQGTAMTRLTKADPVYNARGELEVIDVK